MFVEMLLILLAVGLLLLTLGGHRYLRGALRSLRRQR